MEEILEILRFVMTKSPKTLIDVEKAVEEYFGPIIWSFEKEEWTRMRSSQRIKFCREVLDAISPETKSTGDG